MATLGENNATTPTGSASTWRVAEVVDLRPETLTVQTLVLRLPHPVKHLPGQRYELRLTAADGYQAARPYSAASPGDGSTDLLEITVAVVAEGEVSPYLLERVHVSDQLEVRGPLGKFFMWRPSDPTPLLLIGGGSGVAPLRCIWQAHTASQSTAPLQLLYAARDYDDIIYRDELLADPEHVTIALSRKQPLGWPGASGRISQQLFATALARLVDTPQCYVCGMNAFVEVSVGLLQRLGMPSSRIKTERYGT
jgi:ferredoxin-NADP reductase